MKPAPLARKLLANRRRAFTLIALLAVVAIIALVAATAQLGAHIIDALEVRTSLASSTEWMTVKSYTNYVRPDAAHFDAGWTEIVRELDLSVLPASDTRYFRLKRTWIRR